MDAAETIGARNTPEQMLTHQTAAAHRMAMKLLRWADRELERCYREDTTDEVSRLVNASARMMRAYREGLLTLVYDWLGRYRAEGVDGLRDRPRSGQAGRGC